jgi:hypothetical protein
MLLLAKGLIVLPINGKIVLRHYKEDPEEEKPADRRCSYARSHLIHCTYSDDGSAPRSGV